LIEKSAAIKDRWWTKVLNNLCQRRWRTWKEFAAV